MMNNKMTTEDQEDEIDPQNYLPGTLGCHEALHTARMIFELVDKELCEHPAIKLNDEWLNFAAAARGFLMALYLSIGEKHFPDVEDEIKTAINTTERAG